MSSRYRHHRAFTLLELILVMVIICIVMAIAAPKLQNFREGGKLRNTADEFVAATKFARTQAISSGYVCAVNIDKQSGSFNVQQQNGQQWTAVDGEFGQPITVLDGGQIDSTADPILFYPNGRVQTAQVKITAGSGESISVACSAPTEDFAIAAQQ